MLNRLFRRKVRLVPSHVRPDVFTHDGKVAPFTPSITDLNYRDYSVENCQKLGISLVPMSSYFKQSFDEVAQHLEKVASTLESQILVKSEN